MAAISVGAAKMPISMPWLRHLRVTYPKPNEASELSHRLEMRRGSSSSEATRTSHRPVCMHESFIHETMLSERRRLTPRSDTPCRQKDTTRLDAARYSVSQVSGWMHSMARMTNAKKICSTALPANCFYENPGSRAPRLLPSAAGGCPVVRRASEIFVVARSVSSRSHPEHIEEEKI